MSPGRFLCSLKNTLFKLLVHWGGVEQFQPIFDENFPHQFPHAAVVPNHGCES